MNPAVRTFAIPNELCRRAGIAATWHSINNLGVFAYQHVNTNTPDRQSPYGPSEASVFIVRQDVLLYESTLRKLVNESNGIFLNLQSLVSNEVSNLKQELLKISYQYRSVIRACLENLQDEVVRVDENSSEDIKNYITIFYSVECIWHLCEILFIENIPGNIVLPQLLEWVRFHFPKYERQAAIYLNSKFDNIELDPDYWNTVIGCFLQGRIEVVRALLQLHSSFKNPVFKLFDHTIKSMPIYNVYCGISVTEFNLRWKHWLVETQSKIDAKSFVSESHLNLMMKLAVGEELAWNQVKAQCEAWYELLAYWLFFTEPTVKTFELGQFARRCISRVGVRDRLRHLDQILLSALEADIFQVIKEIQHMSENGWFVTHLTDLLYHAGCLRVLDGSSDELVSSRLRESLIIDYGVLMSAHQSLWQLGLSYLDHCPSDGLHTIELVLQKLPLGTEVRVQMIIREALKRELHHVAQSICKVQGLNCLKRGRMGNALSWALKSQDGYFITYLADRFLREYTNEGKLLCPDLLENLGSAMLFSDRLTFLSKYFEFHKVYAMRDFKEAANIIISLMSSKLTPTYFWVTLLTDALPLLESDEIFFSSNDTFMLLHCLEEKSKMPQLEDKISLIRVAAARNLARALTFEAQKT